MKRRPALLCSLLAVAVLVGLVVWVSGAFETHYDGLTATRYLLGLVGQDTFGGKEMREKILLVPARVGVPILTRFTQAQDSRWRGWYQRVYPRLPRSIAQRLGPPKTSDAAVLRAVMALGYYGPEAQESVPQLLKLNATTTSQLVHQALLTTLGNTEFCAPAVNITCPPSA